MPFKKYCLLALLYSAVSNAEDGLVVHFTIKKTQGSDVSSFTNGVLIKLTEGSTITFAGQYEMHLEALAMPNRDENLVITLKDLSTGIPVYAGAGATTVQIGKSATLQLHQLPQAAARYEVYIDTSYGQLPSPAH